MDYSEYRDSVSNQELNEKDVIETVNNSVSGNPDNNVLTRLSTLSKKLSRRRHDEKIYVDPSDFELDKVLRTILHKSEDQDISLKSTDVVFQNLTVSGSDDQYSYITTVGDILLGPIRAISKKEKKLSGGVRKIIQNVNGICLPGEMVLVLGRPGSGCSTFLKTIAGETSSFKNVEGDITYNNIASNEMMKKYKKDIIYNPEYDVHFPHLTVDQTLKFALACRTPRVRIDGATRDQYIDTVRDILCTVFGLRHTLNTKVGNDFVRGVSGGERKRVSISEALATKACVYCWDNATRGLDASTALEYARAIRSLTNFLGTSSFVTIYQASENIYETFDKVTVLYAGRQIYFGPVNDAKRYFEDMGFHCPPRQSTAEFLTAITDPTGRFPREGMENKVPKTAEEFEQVWLSSSEFAALKEEVSRRSREVEAETTRREFDISDSQDRMKIQRKHSLYTVDYMTQLKLCTVRGGQMIIGDKAYTVTTTVAAIIQALINGSLYWNTPDDTQGAFSRGGVVFFSLLYFSLMGLAEVSNAFQKRPILLKQKGYAFYHPSADVVAQVLTNLPVKFFTSVCFTVIIYFLSNLKQDAGAFFTFLLFLNISAQTMSSFFEMLASVSKNLAMANALSGLGMLIAVVYSSYMIQRPSMHPWFKWISYINPFLYGFESMATTEFHGRHMPCSPLQLIPSGEGYQSLAPENQACAFVGSEPSQTNVLGDNYMNIAFDYRFTHVWRNLGILIGLCIFFIFINGVASELTSPLNAGGDRLCFVRPSLFSKKKQPVIPNSSQSSDVENQPVEPNIQQELETQSSTCEKPTGKVLGSNEVFLWRNVDYTINIKGEERKLLDNVQGFCKPSTLTALMGESGAGKTTLLNVLSQRVDMGVVSGDMLVDGNPITNAFQRRTGYVQQQDIHSAELTVRESLRFAARLRRPTTVSDKEKLDYVEQIIRILDMTAYADATVGESGNGLNVEQRKKLSVGVELVAKPSLLLFLDEPTSGLDSQSSWAIVRVMRQLADAGQAILCTIHQPSATLFEEFDRLLLLQKGGRTVYFGDIGKNSQKMLQYFARQGARTCNKAENPAEYILECIGAGATAAAHENWGEKWENSEEAKDVAKEIHQLISQSQTSESPSEEISVYATPFFYQFYHVLHRTFIQFYRDLQYTMAKANLLILSGLFIGFTFWNLGYTSTDMQNTMFSVFIPVVVSAPLINQIQGKAIKGRELYEARESKSNIYHWSTLLLSQVLVEIPYSIVCSTLFFCCFFFPLRTLSHGASVAGVYWLNYCVFFQLYYISFGLWILYMAPDLPSAGVIMSLLFSFIIAFCGVVQPPSLMPGFWTFMYKVSPYTYFIQNFVGTFLHGRRVECSQKELSIMQPPSGQTCGEFLQSFASERAGYVDNPSATADCGYCQFSVGDDFLSTIGVEFSYRWRNIGFIWVYIIFNLAAMLAFYYMFRVRRFSPVGAVMGLWHRK